MLKAKATLKDDRPLYVFGLTARNLELLRGGRAICIKLEEIGGTGEVIIAFGETDGELARTWANSIGPSTIVSGPHP